ncbi:MAG TPA: M28 family peptidase [Anaerolineae bacterium]|nr:M28 family peptidase [Anaerolineae bacterium]
MEFDPNIAHQYATSIARPRRVGSGENEKVAAEITDRLRSFGYQVDCEPFAFSIAPQLFLALEILLGLMLIAAMFAPDNRARIIPSILFIAFGLAANPINRAVRSRSVLSPAHQPRPLGKWHTTLSSTNIVATLPDLSTDSPLPQIYLVAHYDSKSQWLPLALRIILFVLAITCGLIFATLNLFGADALFANPFGFIAFISALPLLLLDVGNRSPGAIDNASGVGLVLHLAECLRAVPVDRPYNLTVLIPNAEEFSLMGSAAYVKLHARQLGREASRVHVLNFDGIGVDGDLRWIGRGSKLSDLIQQTCRDLNLKLSRFNIHGALYDHLSFADHGLDAVSLIAIGPASRSIHTLQDSIDKLHVRGFDQAGRVALKVIENLTTDYTAVAD